MVEQWRERLEQRAQLEANAAGYARVALDNIDREFPYAVPHTMREPGDFPHRPRARHPVFYGSFDWHSCVEMYWLLVRLLATAGRGAPLGALPEAEIRSALEGHLSADGLAAEAAVMVDRVGGNRERPYGWGWALRLAHELAGWDDPDARRWAERFTPLAETLTGNFLRWLPNATYPVRYGMHPNSAFAVSLTLPYARARAAGGDPELLDALVDAAHRWFGDDRDYPGGWEPSGSDFLSPALTEAELMAQLMPAEEFPSWLERFLPGIADGRPAALFTPAIVSDASDGQTAHLHGLNASRAWCWRRIAESLPPDDPRVGVALTAMRRHADVALPHVAGSDYMVEHWLAAYAVLLLT